jgi:hypothetical protein
MRKFDRKKWLLPALCVLGLCTLMFIAGAFVLRYDLPLARSLKNSFIALEAWYDAWQDAQKTVSGDAQDQDEHIIQNPVVIWDKEQAAPGYVLIGTGYLNFPFLIDREGKIVYRWNIPVGEVWSESGCTNPLKKAITMVDRAYVFPNGDLIAQFGDWGAPYGCGIIKADKDSHILWSYKNGVHHDMSFDKDGNIFSLVGETLSDPQPGFEKLLYPMLADYIVKLSPDGVELDKISILEAFRGTPFELMLYHGKMDGDNLWDFFHTNSVDVLSPDIASKFPLFKAGQILISIRTIGALAVIDPDTRKIIWAYRGFWSYQHAASFLPNGHIMLFDNLGHVEAGQHAYSRILEFDPVTLHTTWFYAGSRENPFVSGRVGRVQRLPNGNTFITESQTARVFEVTPGGDIIWSYRLQKVKRQNDYMNSIFNAQYYTPSELPFLENAAQ